MDRLDCGYHLERGRGSFRTADDEWVGNVDLGPVVLARLRSLELDPEAYGHLIFGILFPPGSELLEGYRTTEILARSQEQVLRLRLHLAPDVEEEALAISWERIYDSNPKQKTALARSPWATFALSLRVLRRPSDPSPPVILRPRVLIAVADAPDLLKVYRLPPLKEMRSALAGQFRRLWWRISARFLRGPVTLTALQDELRKGRFHALHLVAHGLPPAWTDQGVMLQGEDGLAQAIDKKRLAEALSDCPDLRLVVLEICHGGTSLAPPLLQSGIPAVVALRREISIPAAELFASRFYSVLARSGEVDHAVNEARRRLALSEGMSHHWSDPVLYWARAPWRKGLRPVSARLAMAGMCTVGAAFGWGVHPEKECPPHDCLPCPVCEECSECPPRPEPILQVTRVAGQEAAPERELTVPPSGDIEGMFLIPSDPYPIKAESLADGYSASQSGRSSTAGWHLQGVRFRTPESLGETRATVTIEAGEPPGVVSRSVRVRVPAPRVEITHVCDASGPTWIRGTAVNVLEQEEQVWVKVWKKGDGNHPKCLYAPIVDGTWKVEDPWSCRAAKGAATLQAGLVAQPPGSPACPDGKETLDNGVIP